MGDVFAQLVTQEHTPRSIAFGLMPGEMDDLDSSAIKPAHITDLECGNFAYAHSAKDAECQCQFIPLAVAAGFRNAQDTLRFVLA
ncbi:hypothetical protein AQZ52_02100 [Novosphingobium fuchskuhlense]|uniref:Uncharacterized protein n=1 Tax=Novosphingobium fuchskuhlense TaxID=1117702 RepID=A0A124JVC0_9SPHN|nr:hypothetical protein AQZ52_02100 [Novosphingobium fuchskuhlense]